MYHWFLLLGVPRDATAAHTSASVLKFFAHDGLLTASLHSSERRRLFLLGAIESIPALSGGIGASYMESGYVRVSLVIAGLFLCGVVCWLLRNKTPPTRIYASKSHTDHDDSRNA